MELVVSIWARGPNLWCDRRPLIAANLLWDKAELRDPGIGWSGSRGLVRRARAGHLIVYPISGNDDLFHANPS